MRRELILSTKMDASKRAHRLVITVLASFLIAAILISPATVFGASPAKPSPPAESIVIFDTFGGPDGPLEEHSPATDVEGGGWQSIRGDWQVGRGRAFDQWGYGEPYIITVDPESTDYSASIDVKWFGVSAAGLVFRHQDADNYFSAVYSGRFFEIRRTVNGVTSTLKRRLMAWDRFETKTISVNVSAGEISASVDAITLTTTDHQLINASNVGAIVQRTQNDQFKNIEVRALGPQVVPPPISLPSIGDSIVFDSFDGTSALESHTINKAPSGVTWTEHAGSWVVADGSASETTGFEFADQRATLDTGIADTDIYTHLNWDFGRAGVVYRYIDEDNWWMTWTDGNLLLTGSLDSTDGFRLQDITPLDPTTIASPLVIRVRLNGHGIRVYLNEGDIPILKIITDKLEGATRVGLFSRSGSGNNFSEFIVAESPALPEPDELPSPGPDPVKNTPPATPPGLDVYDSFSDYRWTWAGFHELDLVPNDSPWVLDSGDWYADFAQLTEVFGALSDQRAIINSGVADSLITTKFKWSSSRSGIVFRYRNENNLAMAWYDGTGHFVIAKIVEGQFKELALIPMELESGRTFDLSIWTEADTAHVEFEGEYLGEFDVSDLPNSTGVGLFSRNIEAARFDNLSVVQP